jgi:hypothetical protein
MNKNYICEFDNLVPTPIEMTSTTITTASTTTEMTTTNVEITSTTSKKTNGN